MIIPWSFKKLGRVKPFSHPPYVEWKRCYVEDVVEHKRVLVRIMEA